MIIIHYLLYGIVIYLLSYLIKKDHIVRDITPSVSFIIAAYNEEKIIRQKIENDLKLDYPNDKIEIIVVSDGSSDKTLTIVKEYESKGIISLHNPERLGKTSAINRAIAKAKNEIIIFSDANSFFRSDAIRKLVRHFADKQIGGVCGQKSILFNSKREASVADKLFWKYESALKEAESKIGSIVTADGEIFALRKENFISIDSQIINDDMAITCNLIAQNKRVIYEKKAITEEEASLTFKDDFNVKSRMIYGGIQILSLYKNELNPFRSLHGLQFFFHKTLRYFMWMLLVLVFVLNLFCLKKHLFYDAFIILQTIFYIMAAIGYTLDKLKSPTFIFYLPYYYCSVNIAAFKGFIFYLKNYSTVEVWAKAKR